MMFQTSMSHIPVPDLYFSSTYWERNKNSIRLQNIDFSLISGAEIE